MRGLARTTTLAAGLHFSRRGRFWASLGTGRPKMTRLRLAVSLFALCPIVALSAPAPRAKKEDTVEIPEAARVRKNPLPRSPEVARVGRALWQIHCETCHGSSGRGDGPNARLHEQRKGHAPRNLTDPNVQENLTDGEIFWRVSKGIIEGDNIIMPSYEKKIPFETERWQIVLYVRELGQAGKK
jgi:Cytochrome C oxidase, cbb3-type, subunit III